MQLLADAIDGVIRLKEGDTRVPETLVVHDDLVIEGGGAARLVRDADGPIIEHLGGRLTLRGLTLARVGGFDGLLWSRARLVCEHVHLEGVRDWFAQSDPRSQRPWQRRPCTAVIELHETGHATLTGCRWSDNQGVVLTVTDKARATVRGGRVEGRDSSAPDVIQQGRLSMTRVRATDLVEGVSVYGSGARLRMNRCVIATRQRSVVHVIGGTATIKDCTLGPGYEGIGAWHDATVELRGGTVRSCTRNGVFARGTSRVLLRDVKVHDHGWIGVAAGGSARVEVDGGRVSSCVYGALADGCGQLVLDGVTIEDDQRVGVEVSDQADVQESDLHIGDHPEALRRRWHHATWTGATVVAEAMSPDDQLPWIKERLQSPTECPESRAGLLRLLRQDPDALPHGPWLVDRLDRVAPLVRMRGWPALVEAVQAAADDEHAAALSTALEIPTAPAPALLCVRCVDVDGGGGPSFPGWAPDGVPLAWLALPDGAVVAVDTEGVVRHRHRFDEAAHCVHQAGRRLGVASGSTAWLVDLDTGEIIGTWGSRDQELGAIRVVAADAVEIWSLDTQGHPTDRSGRRRHLRPGRGLADGAVLAQRQCLFPPVPPPDMEPLSVEHPDLRVVMSSDSAAAELRASDLDAPLARWPAPDRLSGIVPLGPVILATSSASLYFLRWLPPEG